MAGDFCLFQLRHGHRWSLDDLITAHVAASALPAPRLFCDLGSGIGSVLLMLAWRHPEARGVGIEAQAASVALAERSILWNGVEGRIEVRKADLRNLGALGPLSSFDLITGTPPYFHEGRRPTDPQRLQCRFEERGGPEEYLKAAASLVAPDGRVVLCASVLQTDRVVAGALEAGLGITAKLEVVPRTGKPPLFAVYTAAPGPAIPFRAERLEVRDATFAYSPAMRAIRDGMGFPPASTK